MIHLAALALLGALCLTACVLDLRFRRLPNWLCAVTAVTGIAHAVAIPVVATAWYSSLLHGTVALIIGMVLFAFRWIGGGDAKFYAALACWLPFRQAPLLHSRFWRIVAHSFTILENHGTFIHDSGESWYIIES